MFEPHWKHTSPLDVTGIALLYIYVDDVHTLLEAHASAACYGNSFTFVYVDDVRTSLENHVSTGCYGIALFFVCR
jgi:hypothetical protein